jgi:CRP/FNR family transcriptional regulator, cyclic AMP receptor protein
LVKPARDSFDPKTFLAQVGAGKSICKFSKGQNVFAQGDVADAVFYIQKGKIKLTVVSDQGKEAIVGILEPGQFFGEGCLNGHPVHIATTTAMEDCVITEISKTAMITALESKPKFSQLFMAYLLARNSRIEERLDRPTIQFERETLGTPAASAGKFRQGSQPAAHWRHQPGNTGRNDRHDPITG